MTKEQIAVKDILHLYLKVWGEVSNSTSDTYDDGGWCLSCDVLKEALLGKLNFKPILRPLSSMTEEEARMIAEIAGEPFISYNVFNERIHISTTSTMYGHRDDSSIWIFYKGGRMCLHRNNGNWGGSRMEELLNPFQITRYALSKHFDLFDLIPSGLAIDATTINNQIK